MSAIQLHITDRNHERMSVIASLDNFTWYEGDMIDADTIITNPNISLYCLDDAHQWAVFVVLPDGIDLSQVPFVYLPQLEQAQYLIAVSYDTFLNLANRINVDASQLICIHNIGRCGSTLLCQALNEIEGVIALSEPDVFANFITVRHTSRDKQIQLLQACFKMMFRPTVVGDASRYALKLRNQCVDIMDVYAEAFPQAQHLFMYRNAIDWLASLYRLIVKNGNADRRYTREEAIERQETYLNHHPNDLESYFDASIASYSATTFLAISWLYLMLRYQETVTTQPDIEPVVVRYEDLTAHPKPIMEKLLASLALPTSMLSSAMVAFERDSQAGTRLARDTEQGNTVQPPNEDIEAVRQILSKQPIINRPDYVLSGTLGI